MSEREGWKRGRDGSEGRMGEEGRKGEGIGERADLMEG